MTLPLVLTSRTRFNIYMVIAALNVPPGCWVLWKRLQSPRKPPRIALSALDRFSSDCSHAKGSQDRAKATRNPRALVG